MLRMPRLGSNAVGQTSEHTKWGTAGVLLFPLLNYQKGFPILDSSKQLDSSREKVKGNQAFARGGGEMASPKARKKF